MTDMEWQIRQLTKIKEEDEKDEKNQREAHELKIAEHEAKPMNAPNYDRNKRIQLKQNPYREDLLLDPTNISELKQSVTESLEGIEDRNEIVENLFNVVKKMLTTKQKSVKCQTDQACMNNAQMYEYYSYGDSTSEKKEATLSQKDPMDEKLERIKRERGIDTAEPHSESEDKVPDMRRGETLETDPKDMDVEMLDTVDKYDDGKSIASKGFDI